MIIKGIGMITVEIAKKHQIRLSSPRRHGTALSFRNFGNLGSQLKTRYGDAFGEKWKGDLYHKCNIIKGTFLFQCCNIDTCRWTILKWKGVL